MTQEHDISLRERLQKHKMDVYKEAGIEGLFLTDKSLYGDWPTKIVVGIGFKIFSKIGSINSEAEMIEHDRYNALFAALYGSTALVSAALHEQ